MEAADDAGLSFFKKSKRDLHFEMMMTQVHDATEAICEHLKVVAKAGGVTFGG